LLASSPSIWILLHFQMIYSLSLFLICDRKTKYCGLNNSKHSPNLIYS
jgi:hypothetical protein